MICCYNSEKYLHETIDSVIDQTYTNWEIVIVNDGSTDGTEEIILDYIDQGIPITYLKQENKGFGAARNKAIELAKGDWIAIIDHDDICIPNRLESQVNDIFNSLEMGANSLVLAAETAVGKYPIECIVFLKRMIEVFVHKNKISFK